jgi:hypothetical protein
MPKVRGPTEAAPLALPHGSLERVQHRIPQASSNSVDVNTAREKAMYLPLSEKVGGENRNVEMRGDPTSFARLLNEGPSRKQGPTTVSETIAVLG